MEKKKNYTSLKKLSEAQGLDLFGVADINGIKEDFLINQDIIDRFDKAICLGMRLSRNVLEEIKDKPTSLYFHHYRTVNMLLDQAALRLCNYIQKKGYFALAIPASQLVDWKNRRAHLSHRQIGFLSGLGWIGRNNLLVNKDLGSQFRMVSILTDMPLECDKPNVEECANCRLCLSVCPAGAIKEEPHSFDYSKCFEQLREFQKKRSVDHYVCGICVNICKGESK
ncbi:MAG: hypothetical protein KJ793_01845 [Candidatus Omnitrophica bacterium]|nr:hypothetical protein [Candidatus Omnitrophota bacterium]